MAGEKDSADSDPLSHWPEKGLPLKDALIRFAGKNAYDAYQAVLKQPTAEWRLSTWPGEAWAPGEEYPRLLEPLLTMWNNGEIYASGRPGDSFDRARLTPPASGWKLRIMDLDRGVIVDPRKPSLTFIYDLRFWPTKPEPSSAQLGAQKQAPAVDPYRTGTAGRPTASHLLIAEFKRRRLRGRAPGALKDEAASLLGWLAKKHPDAPPTTQETIQNIIRDAWRTALTKTTKIAATKPTKRPTK
jgi:hypothetical protein